MRSPIALMAFSVSASVLFALVSFCGRSTAAVYGAASESGTALALTWTLACASVAVPLVLKEIIDALDKPRPELMLPLAFILGYGVLRFAKAGSMTIEQVAVAEAEREMAIAAE